MACTLRNKVGITLWSDFPCRMFCKCPYVVRSLVGLQSHKRTHTHTRTYARFCRANLKEQIFFHDATSLFMSKKKKKGSLQSSPLSSVLHGGNCDTWPECRWGQTWGRLELQQREASGGQLLQEPLMEVGNWISMHACAGATPHDGHYIHDALDSCSTHVR